MVNVRIQRDSNRFNIDLNGHALFNPGNDIVCAGISSLVYSLVGLAGNNDYNKKISIGDDQSSIEMIGMDRYLEGATDQLIIGLLQIEKKYPDHVKIELFDNL